MGYVVTYLQYKKKNRNKNSKMRHEKYKKVSKTVYMHKHRKLVEIPIIVFP